MKQRNEQRFQITLAVRIWGMDREGRMFSQQVRTRDLTATSARLTGVSARLDPGCVIGVEHRNSKARFRVAWVAAPGGDRQGQIVIKSIEPGKYIWGFALPRAIGDEPEWLNLVPAPAAD